MNNTVMLVGRIKDIKEQELYVTITNFNNKKDSIIKCNIPENLAKNCIDYLEIDGVVGIKGYLESDEDFNIKLIVDKISFLTSKNKNEN